MKHKGKILAALAAGVALLTVAATYFGSVTVVSTMHESTNYIHTVMGNHQASVVRKISPSNLVAVQNTVILPRTNLAGLYVQIAGEAPSRIELSETNNAASPRYSSTFQGPLNLTNHITWLMPTNPPTAGSTNLAITAVTSGSTGVTNQIGYVSDTGGANSNAIAVFNIDGNVVKLFQEDGWELYAREEFGSLNTSGRTGNEDWTVSAAGGGAVSVLNWGAGGHPGLFEMVTTNATTPDRATAIGGNTGPSSILTTNMQIYFMAMARVRNANDATDVNGLRVGVSSSGSIEGQNHILWKATNNVWELSTGAANLFTNVISSNVVADAWQCMGWFLTTNQVRGFLGATPFGLTTVATNTLRIPGGTSTLAVERLVNTIRIGGTETRMTNQVDYFKIWIRRT